VSAEFPVLRPGVRGSRSTQHPAPCTQHAAGIVNKAETPGSDTVATLAADALPLDRHADIAAHFAPGAVGVLIP